MPAPDNGNDRPHGPRPPANRPEKEVYRLLEFLRSIYVALLFVVIEAVAIGYYAHSSHFTQARILTQSNRLAGGIHSAFSGVKRFFALPAENRQLLERVVALENELSLHREQALYAALDTVGSPVTGPYRYTTARVVSNSINRQENLLTLNKGFDYEVAPETAVVTPSGAMVGYVIGCSERYSVAMSILNTAFRASGEVAGDGHFGSLYWDGFDAEHIRMRDLSKYASVERGDSIVSTSFSRYFPAGILIGTVEEFELNETRTAYDVRIRLAADMTALHDVVLIKNQDSDEQWQLQEGI